MATTTVRFDVPAEVAFDYLVDPANRPEWQSSLKGVELLGGGGIAPGLEWYDVTRVPGVRPLMRLTASERPVAWVESGAFGRFTAVLRLGFRPEGTGCAVTATFRVRGLGLGPLVTASGILAVRSDLKRAARIVAR